LIKCLKYLLFFLFFNLNIDCEYVIITPSYNNIKWWRKNLDQSLSKKYKDYRIIFIDDCSPDGTGIEVNKYVNDLKAKNKLNIRIDIYLNNINRRALNNLYRAIHSCNDNDIVVLVDGDDWLAQDNVFQRLDTEYKKNKKWLTYGHYTQYPSGNLGGGREYNNEISPRRQDFRATHLKSFYAGLFKQIKLTDLLDRNDKLYFMAWDVAFMLPMLEMCGLDKYTFIEDILYKYNCANQASDMYQNSHLQLEIAKTIKLKNPYKEIDSFCNKEIKKIGVYDLQNNIKKLNKDIFNLSFNKISNFMQNTGINNCYIGKNYNLEKIGELVSPTNINEKIYVTRFKKLNIKNQKYLLSMGNTVKPNNKDLVLAINIDD